MTRELSGSEIVLNVEQRAAIESLLRFRSDVQTLGGYAGVGKTTVIKHLVSHLPKFAVCAFTGKAANVLRRKGVEASTIHSLIYNPVDMPNDSVSFVLKKSGLGFDGFIVDEASMVGEALYKDLAQFGLPMIFVGDHGQLEPVGDRAFNLMTKPDIALETIHRNAGEIAHFADFIRRGNDPADWKQKPGGKVRVFSSMPKMNKVVDQVIVGTNPFRVEVNRAWRDALGLPPDHPAIGDRVMCLQNDRKAGVYNGQQGLIKMVSATRMVFMDAGGREVEVRYVPEAFNQVKRNSGRDPYGRIPFDYCYAATCHKCVGDEWDHVLVFEQKAPWLWNQARWSYTAASRARVKLDWVCEGRS